MRGRILESMQMAKFTPHIWDFYHKNKRDLPWRKTTDPYAILISEMMLQQTQVPRVIPKYEEWLKVFPTYKALKNASLEEVLKKWQGLGYNRRAVNLKKIAKIIVNEYNCKLPREEEDLLSLPGIGPYTAGALQAFAWNIPTVFIETNIRSVFLHHFFTNEKEVSDERIFPLIQKTLAIENPREWYWGLMDYGAHLKTLRNNPSQNSKHHTKQSPFKGSNREERSRILRYILKNQPVTPEEISENIKETHNIERNLKALEKEGFITRFSNKFKITK